MQMKNGRGDNDPIEFEITDEELISRIPGTSEGRFRRNGIHKFVENEKVALLYVAKLRFLILPKRALNDEQWLSLRQWLAKGEPNHAG